jgi:hypothetical protein
VNVARERAGESSCSAAAHAATGDIATWENRRSTHYSPTIVFRFELILAREIEAKGLKMTSYTDLVSSPKR